MFSPMTWLALILAGVTALTTSAKAQTTDAPPKVQVLLIGVSEYPHLKADKQLPRAVNDVEALAKWLAEAKVPTDKIRKLTTPDKTTRASVTSEWTEHLKKVAKADASIVYFSGHGAVANSQQRLLTSEFGAKDTKWPQSSVNLQRALNEFGETYPDKIGIFIVDACRTPIPLSGNADDAGASKAWSAPVQAPGGVIVLYAASVNQFALEHLGPDDKEKELSVFTRELLRHLRDRADKDIHDLAKDLKWEVLKLAMTRKGQAGDPEPHVQIPHTFDDAPVRHTILGRRLKEYPSLDLMTKLVTANVVNSIGAKGGLEDEFPCAAAVCPDLVKVSGKGKSKSFNFHMSKYEITRGEWLHYEVAIANEPVKPPPRLSYDVSLGDRRPMAGITYDEAKAYAKWLSKVASTAGSAKVHLDLPTEEEWEFAAGGPDGTGPFPKNEGDQVICRYANGADASLKSVAWANTSCTDGRSRRAATVGSYLPNEFGLHDMAGNVWEWVDGCAEGAEVGNGCVGRIAKGGSWLSGPQALDPAAKQIFDPTVAKPTVGFRLVLRKN